MFLHDKGLVLSATDLAHFLGCRHQTGLEMARALGVLERPYRNDPMTALLVERGLEHERAYVDSLRSTSKKVVDLRERLLPFALAETRDAMAAGADVIVQAALRSDRWLGKPDVLLKVPRPSDLGSWSYEAVDTKLAMETRGATILQLALYSLLLEDAQGVEPEHFHVVTPNTAHPHERYRLSRYAAYFRFIKAKLEETVSRDHAAVAAAHYPEPVELCDICAWWTRCNATRRADDHLSFVAGITRLQRDAVESAGTTTLASLAAMTPPYEIAIKRRSLPALERTVAQAAIQLKGRIANEPVHELLPIEPGLGLASLPEPSPNDVFLDLEGDPFAREHGREYLFGWVVHRDDGPHYECVWAYTDAEERRAFETFIDEVVARAERDPAMRIYHYAPYEPSALKRLMGRHATREKEMDDLLRGERFVDLLAVVRHAIRASVERYSIKSLEPFTGYERAVDLADARDHLRAVERGLELGDVDAITPAARAAVEGYNRDDCVSALRLRDWLEGLRATAIAAGVVCERPVPKDKPASEELKARLERAKQQFAALTAGVPDDAKERSDEQRARWLLANLLEWHRRELKSAYWDFYRLCDLSDDDLLEERAAIANLTLVDEIGTTKEGLSIRRYAFDQQDTDVRVESKLCLAGDGEPFGTVVEMNLASRTIDVKVSRKAATRVVRSAFAFNLVSMNAQADALARLADDVIASGLGPDRLTTCAHELLLRSAPRLVHSEPFVRGAEDTTELAFARRIVTRLDQTALAIQGPPGAGKTYTGAEMICELVRAGKRVGITATSHSVIRHLLGEVVNAADAKGQVVRCAHKNDQTAREGEVIRSLKDNPTALDAVTSGENDVVGGTSWLWAREEFSSTVDVLFVDEAGQMSLANVLAVSGAAGSLVLLGDPQQLEQPIKGSHPDGADVSALDHILGGHQTIPDDVGIFLHETWRLAPSICAFTSELFYEGRLQSRHGLECQTVAGTDGFDGAGLWFVPVDHEGNRNCSEEEVDTVASIVDRLLAGSWTNEKGGFGRVTPSDILVVAPYNAHVCLLAERMPEGVQVGTVDKFQGREAAVVIYSMATSSQEEAPRGMEFLYSLNRLNVATSRARCAAILVACPRLLEPECRSPRQMELANVLCRYRELAREDRVAVRDRGPRSGHR